MRWIRQTGLLLSLCMVTLLCLTGLSLTGCKSTKPPVVTASKSASIKEGMSYAEVEKLIGTKGQKLMPPPPPPNAPPQTGKMEIYSWVNPDQSTLTCTFVDDKLTVKQEMPAPTIVPVTPRTKK